MKQVSLILSCLLIIGSIQMVAQTAPEPGMPNEPGKCYAKCLIADQYETVTEQILVKEATTRVEIVPGSTETLSEQVLKSEGSNTLSVVPAQFETVTEQVLKSEGSSAVTISPATFETVTEQVLASDGANDLRVIPATFETVTEQILKAEGSSSVSITPATFETVSEQVLASEGSSDVRITSAQFETASEEIITQDGASDLRISPAQFETASEQVLKAEGSSSVRISPAQFETVTEQVISNTCAAGSGGYRGGTALNVNFNSGSAVLTAASSSEISRIASTIDCGSGVNRIVGHTDSQGSETANATLSRNRAKAVYNALIGAGVDAGCLTYDGAGESSPIADNSTSAGRSTNRRVELITPSVAASNDANQDPNCIVNYRVIPAQFETVTEQVLQSEGTSDVRISPATFETVTEQILKSDGCLLYTSPSPRDRTRSRMPSSA